MKIIIFLIGIFVSHCCAQRLQTITHSSSVGPSNTPHIYWKRAKDNNNLAIKIAKTCYTGNYVFYTNENMEGDGIFLSGKDECQEWGEDTIIKSQDVLGDPSDYEANYLIIGSENNYRKLLYTYPSNGDIPQMSQFVSSIVLIGTNSSVTLYSNPDYQGIPLCFTNVGKISGGISNLTELLGFEFTSRSIKRGCHSTGIIPM